jgi:hypothetical protein
MEVIVSIILITIGLWLIRKILAQSLRGEVDLLSTRNFFFRGLPDLSPDQRRLGGVVPAHR